MISAVVDGYVGIVPSVVSACSSKRSPIVWETVADATGDACVLDVGTDVTFGIDASTVRGELLATVLEGVRMVSKSVGVDGGETSESAPGIGRGLRDPVTEVVISSITAKKSYPSTLSFLLEPAADPTTTTEAFRPTAMAAGVMDTASALIT